MTCKTFYRVNPQTDERWKSYLCDIFDDLPTNGCLQGEWAIVKTPTRRMFLHSGSVWEEKGVGGAAAWGSITGTLSSQTDLNGALSGKSDTGHNHSGVYESANANIQSHVTSAHAPPNAQANADITKAEIEAKLTGEISSHSHAGGSQAFPIGAVFLSVVATNPATLLGYGTWAAIAAGRMLVGLDSGDANFDVVEETGGAKTLNAAHTNNHSGTAIGNHSNVAVPGTATSAVKVGTSTSSAAAQTHTHTISTITHTVTSQPNAHDNHQDSILNPYFVVYIWKRTA